MTASAWRLRWRVALRRRRLLAWNVLIPLLLLVPVVTSGAAASHRAVVVAVFVAFFGTYGSCIPLIRDGMSGWAEKVLLTGYGGGRWLLERTAASVTIDFVQLLPANLVLFWLIGTSMQGGLMLLVVTLLALLFANLLGVLVAAAVGALGEAALGCAVLSLFVLHASGVFRAPASGSMWETVEAWSPLRPVHEYWLSALRDGVPAPTAGNGGLVETLASPTLAAIAACVLMFVGGAWLAGRIARCRSD